MGAFEEIKPEERDIDLAPGDTIVLYTDGVTEAMNEESQMFGKERLQAVVATNIGANAQALLDAIVEAVNNFIGDTPQSDDYTMLIVKREER